MTVALNWASGVTIPLGTGRKLGVIEIRPGGDADQPPVLVVEDVAERASSAER
jgi:hypothetical protein